jgi:Replicative DNA helicase
MNKNINIPFALDYKEATLGALPLETKAMSITCQRLRPKVFYDDKHQIISAIEQDADIVLLLHRPALYKVTTDKDSGYPTEGFGVLNIAKHRNGEMGNVYFSHNKSMTKISDYVPPMEWLMKQAK